MGLCKSKLPEMGRALRPQEKDILKSPLIIFVMGGPDRGKGMQCKNMATKYGFCHVGLGQVLQQEAQRSTQRGRQIRDIMLQGLLVPPVGRTPSVVIIFDCSMETMVQRVLHWGQMKQRADDLELAICQPGHALHLVRASLDLLPEDPAPKHPGRGSTREHLCQALLCD
ncbi:adenylate kinase isoenzyme 5 [Chlorocebus sabaeus]|uniref:adenylate kinase isoenzyme 5 n=1 Tax=Chlorocebus sabaeus TaxID=60711 RepID=UPI003BF9DD0D